MCCIGRRTFCKTVPCLALGAVSGSRILEWTIAQNKDTSAGKESRMPGKITAVQARVISQEGECEMGHKVGDIITFTESGIQGSICIHALYSLLPKVFAMMYEARFPWLENPDVSTHACPDAYNPVVFEITRIRDE
jgi:uncharacterized repeat protein (TIGR04076 family)